MTTHYDFEAEDDAYLEHTPDHYLFTPLDSDARLVYNALLDVTEPLPTTSDLDYLVVNFDFVHLVGRDRLENEIIPLLLGRGGIGLVRRMETLLREQGVLLKWRRRD